MGDLIKVGDLIIDKESLINREGGGLGHTNFIFSFTSCSKYLKCDLKNYGTYRKVHVL